MVQPLVSVVVPTHNRKSMLNRLVNSLLNGSYKHIELIIIDDASTDGTYEFIRSHYKKEKRIKILRNKINLHTSASKNRGSEIAKGEYVYYIDDDNIATKDLISNLVRGITSDHLIGEVGPVIYSHKNPKKILWSRTQRNMWTSKTNASTKLLKDIAWDTDDVPNTFMVRAKLIKKDKVMFNSKLGIMYEESDLAYKIKNLGYSIKVIKNAKVYHDVFPQKNDKLLFSHTMSSTLRAYYTARNRIIFHAVYSTKIQLLSILLFWNWLFAIFYIYHILFYAGPGKYSFFSKARLTYSYITGVFDGYLYVVTNLNI